jgi:hypothetical protein
VTQQIGKEESKANVKALGCNAGSGGYLNPNHVNMD